MVFFDEGFPYHQVLDRLCLFFFSAFTLVATVAVLAVAPHIIVY